MAKGVIYILTNPSFPDYVKIGYASDIEKRLKQLNRSETIPFAFRVYAIYEVEKSLTDKELHKLIDNLNPDLRTIENFDGKERVKEFYAMSPEDAYGLLECIAKISGTIDRLKRLTPEGHEILDEQIAECNSKMSGKESALKKKQEEKNKYQARLENLSMSIVQNDTEIRNVKQNFQDNYSRDLMEFEERMYTITATSAELREKLAATRQKIADLGQVNLMAIEMFAEEKERYERQQASYDDTKKNI